jgi:hypothetical protein
MTATALRLLPPDDQHVEPRYAVLVDVRVRGVAHRVRARARATAILREIRSGEMFEQALTALDERAPIGRVEVGAVMKFGHVSPGMVRQLRARAAASGVRIGDVVTAALAAWMEKR